MLLSKKHYAFLFVCIALLFAFQNCSQSEGLTIKVTPINGSVIKSSDQSSNDNNNISNTPFVEEGKKDPLASQNPDQLGQPLYLNSVLGILDQTFLIPPYGLNKIYSIDTFTNHKIILGSEFPNNLLRLNSEGSLDSNFSAPNNSSFSDEVKVVKVQTDQKILVGGEFKGIKRVNSDGSLDVEFNVHAASSITQSVSQIIIQPDTKILIAGGNLNSGFLIRLNGDGSQDSSFTNLKLYRAVTSMALQPSGKIIITGGFMGYIKRVSVNGEIENNFSTLVGDFVNNEVVSIASQSDGKFYLSEYSGVIQRFNEDGSIDTTFKASPFSFSADRILVEKGGPLIVGSSTKEGLYRLNPDGSRDLDFENSVGSKINFKVNALHAQSDGQILVGGGLESSSNQFKGQLVRIK